MQLHPRLGLLNVAGAAALGAATMYLLDPDKGRRRRAGGRDKLAKGLTQAARFAGIAARDLAHRARGLVVHARRFVWRQPASDDLQLIERIRAKVGRVVAHPHAIQVGAHLGHVIVSGPVLASEVQKIRNAVSAVPGVAGIEDHLVVHQRAGTVSSLQGGFAQPRARVAFIGENWTPALRAATVLGGIVVALYGMRRRTPAGHAVGEYGCLSRRTRCDECSDEATLARGASGQALEQDSRIRWRNSAAATGVRRADETSNALPPSLRVVQQSNAVHAAAAALDRSQLHRYRSPYAGAIVHKHGRLRWLSMR